MTEVERLQVIESKWTELLPKIEILRHHLFRVDRKIASLEMVNEPGEIIDFTSAFLSVLEFYFPSTEEEELVKSELTRLERLGLELSQTGAELKEEVKLEFASLKAQIETETERLEKDNKELRAEVARLKQYTNQRLFAAASGVVEAWDDYNQVSIPSLIEALEEQFIPRLIEAVAWWDSLPFDPDKDTERLPKYEMEAES